MEYTSSDRYWPRRSTDREEIASLTFFEDSVRAMDMLFFRWKDVSMGFCFDWKICEREIEMLAHLLFKGLLSTHHGYRFCQRM